jgi:pimeloyl-CoA dehydrogenase small subunit
MNFALSEEQKMMQDGLRRLLQKSYSFEHRKELQKSAAGWSHDVWRQYAEMGLLALPFDDTDGGLSGTPVETMIVMEELGRAITLEPYIATVVQAGGIIRHAGSDQQKQRIIEKIIDGSAILTLAHQEEQARYDLACIGTTAKLVDGAWQLNGQKSFALHGDSADMLIVSARISGNTTDKDGIALFLLDANSAGVGIDGYRTHDGQRAASVTLKSATVGADGVIGTPGKMYPVLERVCQETIAALCAEAVGVMAALHEATVDYLKQRRQFGVPIGSFQVLQHRAAEMYMALEQARSMAMFATIMSSDQDAAARAQAISAAKVQIGRSGRLIGEQAVQLHGGIAIAMEYKAGHYFKKLTMLDQSLGDADHHLELLSQGGSLFEKA